MQYSIHTFGTTGLYTRDYHVHGNERRRRKEEAHECVAFPSPLQALVDVVGAALDWQWKDFMVSVCMCM